MNSRETPVTSNRTCGTLGHTMPPTGTITLQTYFYGIRTTRFGFCICTLIPSGNSR